MFKNLAKTAISLQSRISSSPRGLTTSYFTCNRLRVVSSISGLLSAVGAVLTTPKPHGFTEYHLGETNGQNQLRSSFWASLRHEIRRRVPYGFGDNFIQKYPCANFSAFLPQFSSNRMHSVLKRDYLQNPTHAVGWVE